MKKQSLHKAFTAIEIIIVLAIVAILVTAIVPTIRQYLPNVQLNGSSKNLVANLREAQQRAITEQNRYLVRFNSDAVPYHYSLIRILDSNEQEIRKIYLSTNINLLVDSSISGKQVIFSPDGGPSSSGNITLSNNDAQKVIHISPAGFIRIE